MLWICGCYSRLVDSSRLMDGHYSGLVDSVLDLQILFYVERHYSRLAEFILDMFLCFMVSEIIITI